MTHDLMTDPTLVCGARVVNVPASSFILVSSQAHAKMTCPECGHDEYVPVDLC